MKVKIKACFYILILSIPIIFTNCTTTKHSDFSLYNFSFKNTLSAFLLNNDNCFFICIPLQYIGNYQISCFEFDNGNIQIGDFNISLDKKM